MGLFDRFKKKEEPKKEETDVTMYSVPLSDGVSEIQVNGLIRAGGFKHRDNTRTELIMGRIGQIIPDDTVFFDSMDYIAFELPVGQRITEADIYAAVNQYILMKNQTQSQSKAFYTGQIQNGEVVGRSTAVEQYVEKTVAQMEDSRAQENKAQMEARQKEEAIRREKQREEDEKRRIEYETRKAIRGNERKQNAKLTVSAMDYQMQGKTFSDYDGVNMITGDIMRLRRVNKVGKDADGTYLYSGFISTVETEDAMELFAINEDPPGDYVCFTLPGKLEDIVRSGDTTQIRNVLELLSLSNDYMPGLTYIGGLDKYGQISRDAMPRSTGIANKIAQMKQEYSERIKQAINRNHYNTGDER